MIHIAICDDEPVQVRLLSQLVGDWFLGRSILRRTFCCWTF